jgi:two-component system, response regulator, stage 0 sporulation protein F
LIGRDRPGCIDRMKNAVTILAVDDEPVMRSLLNKILTRDGYMVLVAAGGREAMDILERQRVDIVVSDLKMPEIDGLELLRMVKERYPQVAIIMMTAYGDTYTVKDALLLGADEYITKPFKSFEISLVVERAYWRIMAGADSPAPTEE